MLLSVRVKDQHGKIRQPWMIVLVTEATTFEAILRQAYPGQEAYVIRKIKVAKAAEGTSSVQPCY
jgi:hypothetical protein